MDCRTISKRQLTDWGRGCRIGYLGTVGLDLVPLQNLNLTCRFGLDVGVRLSYYDDLVVMFSCIIDKFEEVRQEIRANDDGRWRVSLQNT